MFYCQVNVFKWSKSLEKFSCVRKKAAVFLWQASSLKPQMSPTHLRVAGSHQAQWPRGRGLDPRGEGALSLLPHPSVLLQRQTGLAVPPSLLFLFSTCLLFILQLTAKTEKKKSFCRYSTIQNQKIAVWGEIKMESFERHLLNNWFLLLSLIIVVDDFQ